MGQAVSPKIFSTGSAPVWRGMRPGREGAATSGRHLAYRREIDGLRAIAVLAVVLFHFSVPGLQGGFVGVDVFFVISGYLIGGLLVDELAHSGKIDLVAFYMRRIRRLAPAFFAMALCSWIVGWFVLLPFEYRNFGKELIASSVWASNVLFYREAGYFDIGAENRVLLHTWSLSVEEQFYVFLPLCLMLVASLRRNGGAIAICVGLLWAVSLAACVVLTPTHPTATFYLFPYRAWELLSGVLVALALRHPALKARLTPHLAQALSWAGLALVLVSIAVVRSADFPGWQALLPVVGTCALIAGTGVAGERRGQVTRVLAHPALAFIGVISYSLYLWHWPVLILSRYWRDGYRSPGESAAWLALVFALSMLSWRFVEQPFRRGPHPHPVKLLGGMTLAGTMAVALGFMIWSGNGLSDRFSPDTRVHITASSGFLQDTSRCSQAAEGPLAGITTCAIGPEGPPQVLIWGDSHLRAQMDGLALAAREAKSPGVIIWHAGCPPLFGIAKQESAATPDEDRACLTDNLRIRDALRHFPSVRRLLLVGRWSYYADGIGVGRDANNVIRLSAIDGSGLPRGEAQSALFGAALRMTIGELAHDGYQVFLLRQVPELPFYNSPIVAREMAHGRLTADQARRLATVSIPDALARQRLAEDAIDPLVAAGNVRLIDPWPRLCAAQCSGMQRGVSFYFDNNHMTYAGAVALRDLFLPFLSGDQAGKRT
ncbi:acyltransferase family protein [Novosphingobium sp. BL-8H]|uniref:acyltransferase family protein n=1 Tax=Novosphingobium sp. BL-8H TaxID=3127640 RepID=UPI003758021E